MDLITLALAKKAAAEMLAGAGAVAGKNCIIQSITPVDGGNEVTFSWTMDDGSTKIETMFVADGGIGPQGEKGETGVRGNRWNIGTAITGTSTTPTSFATGIADSLPDDFYLNNSTGCIYRCTVGGDAATSKWIYTGTFSELANAASLGGETAAQWQTKLDNIQTTSRATLSQAGWYRVAEYEALSEFRRKGNSANACDLIIKRIYDYTNNEYHHLKLRSTYNEQDFVSLDSKSNTQSFTKIRYTYDSESAYLEVYYNKATENPCTFIIINGDDYSQNWQAIAPTLTSETVDGVTVTTTYDIPANASPVTDLDLTTALAGYLKNTGGIINGNIQIIASDTTARYETIGNSLRKISLGVTSVGTAYLQDDTNNQAIIRSYPDGTNTFNGTATGNLALNEGGTVHGAVKVQCAISYPLELESTNTDFTNIKFNGVSGSLGHLGFVAKHTPAFYESDGDTAHKLLHTGNSAKVVQSTSAPSDTNAIWIDTANKKVKAYIDGAWTIIA